jgi:NAD(P)H-nitrite reductase large subunit
MGTAAPNIFAAGDAAHLAAEQVRGISSEVGWLRAWRQGRIAGINMAGADATYKDNPSLRTKILDLDVVCLGSSDAQGEGVRIESGDFPFPELPYIYKRLTYVDDRIAGAIFIGDVSEAGVVDEWIGKGLKASQCDRAVLEKIFSTRFQRSGAQGVLCPVCKYQMQLESGAGEGTIVTCPACGIDFRMERLPNGNLHAVAVG